MIINQVLVALPDDLAFFPERAGDHEDIRTPARQSGKGTAGEQRLIVELARADGARTVTDLAAAVGISNQSASAAQGRLTTGGWVHPGKADSGDRRATWYDLSDPLLRNYLHYRERRQR